MRVRAPFSIQRSDKLSIYFYFFALNKIKKIDIKTHLSTLKRNMRASQIDLRHAHQVL